MAINDSLLNAFKKAATEIKTIKGGIGDLKSLATTAKANLVTAINEVKQDAINNLALIDSTKAIIIPFSSISNTAAETVIAEFSLNKGNVDSYFWRYTFFGLFRNDAVANPSFRLRLRLGGLTGTVLFDSNNVAVALGTNGQIRRWKLDGHLLASPNLLRNHSTFNLGAAMATNSIVGVSTVGSFYGWNSVHSQDLTNAVPLVLTVQINVASVNAISTLVGGTFQFNR